MLQQQQPCGVAAGFARAASLCNADDVCVSGGGGGGGRYGMQVAHDMVAAAAAVVSFALGTKL